MRTQPALGAQPAKPGWPRRESSTYVRQGTARLLAAFESGTSQRLVEVSARRTGADYGRFMQILAAHYPQAEKIVLVQDNLNAHTDAVFYQHLPDAQARGLATTSLITRPNGGIQPAVISSSTAPKPIFNLRFNSGQLR